MGNQESYLIDQVDSLVGGRDLKKTLRQCYRYSNWSRLPAIRAESNRYGQILCAVDAENRYVFQKILLYDNPTIFIRDISNLNYFLSLKIEGFLRLYDYSSEKLPKSRAYCLQLYIEYPQHTLADRLSRQVLKSVHLVRILKAVVKVLADCQAKGGQYGDLRPESIAVFQNLPNHPSINPTADLSKSQKTDPFSPTYDYKLLPLLPRGHQLPVEDHIFEVSTRYLSEANPSGKYTCPYVYKQLVHNRPLDFTEYNIHKGDIFSLGLILLELGTGIDISVIYDRKVGEIKPKELAKINQIFIDLHRSYSSLADIVSKMVSLDQITGIDATDLNNALQPGAGYFIHTKVVNKVFIEDGVGIEYDIYGNPVPESNPMQPLTFGHMNDYHIQGYAPTEYERAHQVYMNRTFNNIQPERYHKKKGFFDFGDSDSDSEDEWHTLQEPTNNVWGKAPAGKYQFPVLPPVQLFNPVAASRGQSNRIVGPMGDQSIIEPLAPTGLQNQYQRYPGAGRNSINQSLQNPNNMNSMGNYNGMNPVRQSIQPNQLNTFQPSRNLLQNPHQSKLNSLGTGNPQESHYQQGFQNTSTSNLRPQSADPTRATIGSDGRPLNPISHISQPKQIGQMGQQANMNNLSNNSHLSSQLNQLESIMADPAVKSYLQQKMVQQPGIPQTQSYNSYNQIQNSNMGMMNGQYGMNRMNGMNGMNGMGGMNGIYGMNGMNNMNGMYASGYPGQYPSGGMGYQPPGDMSMSYFPHHLAANPRMYQRGDKSFFAEDAMHRLSEGNRLTDETMEVLQKEREEKAREELRLSQRAGHEFQSHIHGSGGRAAGMQHSRSSKSGFGTRDRQIF